MYNINKKKGQATFEDAVFVLADQSIVEVLVAYTADCSLEEPAHLHPDEPRVKDWLITIHTWRLEVVIAGIGHTISVTDKKAIKKIEEAIIEEIEHKLLTN